MARLGIFFTGPNGLVSSAVVLLEVPIVQVKPVYDEPAAHFSNEHLEGLDDGLLEVVALFEVGVGAVADADLVLQFGEEGVGGYRGGGLEYLFRIIAIAGMKIKVESEGLE